MRKCFLIPTLATLTIMLCVGFIACKKEEPTNLNPLTNAEISGEILWRRIKTESPYENYQFFPNLDGLRAGQAPHGAFHIVYVNNVLSRALPLDKKIAPNGTIVVKENYTPEEDLAAITVMAKVEGFSPETNDWFWAMFSPEGNVNAEGSLQGCIDCHSGMKSNDYIVLHQLDGPVD
jgi:hypothetical protein